MSSALSSQLPVLSHGTAALVATLAPLEAILRTTYGPYGADKLVVDADAHLVVCSDAATILAALKTNAPAAQLVLDAAKSLKQELGDGVTSFALLTVRLIQRLQHLRQQGVLLRRMCSDLHQASSHAIACIRRASTPMHLSGCTRADLAAGALSGAAGAADALAELIAAAAARVSDPGHVTLLPLVGAGAGRSFHLPGVVLPAPRTITASHGSAAAALPVAGAVLVLAGVNADSATSRVWNARAASPSSVDAIAAVAHQRFADTCDAILRLHPVLLVAQSSLPVDIASFLAHHGIVVIDMADTTLIAAVARATGATPVHDVISATASVLGQAQQISRLDSMRDAVAVHGAGPHSSIVLCASTSAAAEQTVRAAAAALAVCVPVPDAVIGGAGAAFLAAAAGVRRAFPTVLTARCLADALDSLPLQLVVNAGHSDAAGLLQHAHDLLAQAEEDMVQGREAGDVAGRLGFDLAAGTVSRDVLSQHVVEASRVPLRVIRAACDTAVQLLTIDTTVLHPPRKSPEQLGLY